MRIAQQRLVACACLLTLTAGCSSESEPFVWPTTPSGPSTPSPPFISKEYTPEWPPLGRVARVYQLVENSERTQMFGTPSASRYVLNEDGSFVLQTTNARLTFHETGGSYTEADGAVTLVFAASPTWRATATATEDALDVHYNPAMLWADFWDASYFRQREAR